MNYFKNCEYLKKYIVVVQESYKANTPKKV